MKSVLTSVYRRHGECARRYDKAKPARVHPPTVSALALVGIGLLSTATVGCAEPISPSTLAGARTQAIVGGDFVAPGAWRSVVQLDNECTGVIIHEQYVLTAAHCSVPSWAWTGMAPDDVSEGRATRGCLTYPGGGVGTGTDVALCELVPPVSDVEVVPILMGCERDTMLAAEKATLVGYGTSSIEGTDLEPKRVVEAPIVSIGDEIEIGDDSSGTCHGDSGGPAFIRVDDGKADPSWRLAGIMSSGYRDSCGVGFYSEMSNLIDWLERVTHRDLSPCFDDSGAWLPSYGCREPLLDAQGQRREEVAPAASESCGAPVDLSVSDVEPPTITDFTSAADTVGNVTYVQVAAEDFGWGVRGARAEVLLGPQAVQASQYSEIPPFSFTLPWGQRRGTVRITVSDWAGNESSREQSLAEMAEADGCTISGWGVSSPRGLFACLIALLAFPLRKLRRASLHPTHGSSAG